MNVLLLIAAVVVGTWNGNWFPSGRAEHRAHPAVEDATITAAAEMLARGLTAIDPLETNDVILCLNEIRGPKAASNLVQRIGRKGLRVVAISGYRRRDRFDQQQDVIATTLPVVTTGWQKFSNAGAETPPRGYVYASLVVTPAQTSQVYAVHLKSNYGGGKSETAKLNRAKRTRAIAELTQAEDARGGCGSSAIIAGDLNADKWKSEFADEKIFSILESAGYLNVLQLLPPRRRGTHPSRTYGDSALDYVFARKFDSVAVPQIIPNDRLSDHCAFFTLLSPPAGGTH